MAFCFQHSWIYRLFCWCCLPLFPVLSAQPSPSYQHFYGYKLYWLRDELLRFVLLRWTIQFTIVYIPIYYLYSLSRSRPQFLCFLSFSHIFTRSVFIVEKKAVYFPLISRKQCYAQYSVNWIVIEALIVNALRFCIVLHRIVWYCQHAEYTTAIRKVLRTLLDNCFYPLRQNINGI